MNIFATHPDPVKSARSLDDKRVGKMLMEACQMLSVAAKLSWPQDDLVFLPLYESNDSFTKGYAYQNHPCTIWVRQTRANYSWLHLHAVALAAEYAVRYGREHGAADRLTFLENQRDCLPPGDLLPFANCARNAGRGLDFTMYPVHEAYRRYLVARWQDDVRAVTFANRGEPEWLQEFQSCM